MAALASCLLDMGKTVSGWDVAEDFVTQGMLDQLAIQITQDLVLPPHIDAVIFTAAHQDAQHPLVKQAQDKQIPCFSLAEVSGAISKEKPTIAVCGVGGKSTTSAMLAWIMQSVSSEASYMVGVGEIIGLTKTGAWSQKSAAFCIEADEYATNPSQVALGHAPQPRFLSLKPETIICTQILHDHPDVYPTLADTQRIFGQFFQSLPPDGLLIINSDDMLSLSAAESIKLSHPQATIVTIGNSKAASVQLQQSSSRAGVTSTTLVAPQLSAAPFELKLKIPGTYNLWNAAAALVAATQYGLPLKSVLKSLAGFASTSRRLESKGQHGSTLFYDDYAHHPFEISAAIRALREWHPHRSLCVVFQPHTFSRTKAMLAEFAHSLSQADRVVILPIFASARESSFSDISSQDLVAQINALHTPAEFCTSLADAHAHFAQLKEDVVVTMGAGDVYTLHTPLTSES